jgi:3-hydroxyacyl-[acyl-carrier-protein] dehydratase
MAATPFVDLSTVDLTQVVADHEAIYRVLPHRYEFAQLDAVIQLDKVNYIAIARREVRPDEFWVRGHIPGRPILPGVLMIETAAQLASYMAAVLGDATDKFIGFARVDNVCFRGAVSPPATLYFLMKMVEHRPRRIVGEGQAILDGKLIFEARITGMPI